MSMNPFLLHELVHAAMITLGYPYQPFFGEGLAVALDPLNGDGLGPTYGTAAVEGLPDPRPWMTSSAEDLQYGVAGAFVGFLLSRHGGARFLKFASALGDSRDMPVIEKTFKAVYGTELAEEAKLYMVGVPCTQDSLGPALYDCTAPRVAWNEGSLAFSGVMDCASDDVAGGFSDEVGWPSIRSVSFEVPNSGNYWFHLKSDGDTTVQIGRCPGCPWQRDIGRVEPTEEIVVKLEAGIHYARIRSRSNVSPSFTLEIVDLGY